MRKIICICLALASFSVQAQFITNKGMNIKNSALLTSNGDWSNGAGSIFTNNGRIIVTEDWTNNGTVNGTGALVLNYLTDKNFISGNNTIGRLIKDGHGNVLITGSLHVSDTLLLSRGKLLLSANDTLLLKSDNVLVNDTSYAVGIVAHSGTGIRLFPFGKDGYYLPLKLNKLNASKATATIEDTPAGYTQGGGVEALINFPYVWKVDKRTAADTSAYVEVNYPSTLPTAPNPIIVRGTSNNQFVSMGARHFDQTAGRATVKSYSRRLEGIFSVAKGFPSDFITDSLALVALYTSNNGAGWVNKTNWLQTTIDQWSGVTVFGQSITEVRLPNNNLTGPLADQLSDILSLQVVDISNNAITTIPNFTEQAQLTSVNVSNNNLEFGTLEPNASLIGPASLQYHTQGVYGTPKTTLVDVGTSYDVNTDIGGSTNKYQWSFKGQPVGNTTDTSFHTIAAAGRADMGDYTCEVTNDLFPGLTITTAPETVLVTATISGKLFAHLNQPATKGKVTLFKVNAVGKYDTTAVQNIATDGTYSLQKIILDDYQLLGFVDTLTYTDALPTYYQSTVYWEEANTIVVENNLSDMDVTSLYKPSNPPIGKGDVSGYFEDPTVDVPEGRMETAKRVAGAGTSVRKVENSGRIKEEILTLIAYVFTNENGEFSLSELPKGNYRLNLQYPGYPMDPSSDINVTIGDAGQSQVRVAARVEDNKIVVHALHITGTENQSGVKIFPNPTADHILISFDEEESGRTATLINITGKEIFTESVDSKENSLNVRSCPAGVYVLTIHQKGVETKKVRVVIE